MSAFMDFALGVLVGLACLMGLTAVFTLALALRPLAKYQSPMLEPAEPRYDPESGWDGHEVDLKKLGW